MELSYSCSNKMASQVTKMYLLLFRGNYSPRLVKRKWPPTGQPIYRWYKQFLETSFLCKATAVVIQVQPKPLWGMWGERSFGVPGNHRRRACAKPQIPQRTVWRNFKRELKWNLTYTPYCRWLRRMERGNMACFVAKYCRICSMTNMCRIEWYSLTRQRLISVNTWIRAVWEHSKLKSGCLSVNCPRFSYCDLSFIITGNILWMQIICERKGLSAYFAAHSVSTWSFVIPTRRCSTLLPEWCAPLSAR